MASVQLRRETITLNVDFENLVCTRGDYVIVAHDVMKAGGTPARVKTIAGNQITIDDGVVVGPGSYGYTFRSSIGEIKTSTLSVVNSKTFDLNGDLPAVGDLIVIGVVSQITIDCLVKSIEPGPDFTATLTLIERAPAVYLSESEDDIPLYTPIINADLGNADTAPGPISNLQVLENSYDCTGNGYEYFISLQWDAPTTGAYEIFEVYVNYGDGYVLHDFSSITTYKYVVNQNNLAVPHSFKILAVAANGSKLGLGEISTTVEATPIAKATPPSDVLGLYINITGEVLQLDWPKVLDCDISEYLIRYSPSAYATWETSSPLLRVDRSTTLASVQARVGTYLIKAVDFNNNESFTAARAYTSIPNLFNLNVIDEITDFPALTGNKDSVEAFDSSLLLKKLVVGPPEQYFSDGYYYFSNLLDLGEIYTVRLQSLIQAEGFTVADLMSEWPDLLSLASMSSSQFGDWAVSTEFRMTDTYNTMSSWSSLSDVAAMSSGDEDVWTPWTPFTIGDFTGRIFQFRLRLQSFKPNVTPRVFSAVVKADMPDRIESYNNLSATPAGLNVVYSPAFKGPGTSPAIAITQDAAQQGDYFVISGKTLEGFTITFYDKDNNAVTRQFDAMVKGYGRKHTVVI